VSAMKASPADSGIGVIDKVSVDKVRALQHTLYWTAKADPGRRFHALWDKVLRRDVLWRTWVAVRTNNGAPGVDWPTSLDGFVIAPRANKPWRERPNAGGERRR
jgi:hypothetical protein